MKTDLYWISGAWPGRVAIMPRPRGGDWLSDEVRAWRGEAVDVVVSLLDGDEAAEFELGDEGSASRAGGIEFVAFPIADRGVPESREAAGALVAKLEADVREGKNVAIHCRQGIGRAALVAAALLIRLGVDPDTAVARVGAARGRSVPETPEQHQWIAEFARLAPNAISP